ncbi:MAG: peptidoglycan DD-metalloendopeptidase family protein [Solirubrobacterales bacterium]|nr:peptidoglycan DD-metalloendopeptidase family protein [Solirubrobacterales bacterium]MCB8971445.1 peptidoglycan DD-metalloendopeptidase family protein [Thermoleophilales bacterium]MCO5327496.1 peptidoglycan DD-metalloendopeptidase family protein [Solirubrobacterales bacterium]
MPSPSRTSRRATTALLALAVLVLAGLALAAIAPADDLQGKLDKKQDELGKAKDKKVLLTTEVSRYNDQIEQLTGEVAALRNREAAVQADLDSAQDQLDSAQHDLKVLRERLRRSIDALEERLVDIYKEDEPDTLTAILESDGYDDALSRYEYLQTLQSQNSDLVGRVRDLRDDTAATVEKVRTTRDSIRSRREELRATRASLEQREAELDAARARSKKALSRVGSHVEDLHDDVSDIEDKIQKQLAAAALADSGVAALPAGAIQDAGGGFIWPVNGPIVSPFGMRWGRLHAGVDIAVPAGTPIRAAKDGTIVLNQTEAESGGYGNYTCIDHGGGVSTCYAHQSSFAITSGPVKQGEIIGYVGCTGHCFGDHLHFEVRINGVPTDPMAYL